MSEALLRLRRRRLRRLHRRISICVPVVVLGVGIASMAWAMHLAIDRQTCDGPRNQAYEIAKSCEIFRLQAGRWPRQLDELVTPPRPHKAIMEQEPRDPWGRPWQVLTPGARNVDRFDVVSAGPDGVFFTADDIGNWLE